MIKNRGKELLAELETIMTNDYGIPCNSINTRIPKVNAIVERAQHIIGNII